MSLNFWQKHKYIVFFLFNMVVFISCANYKIIQIEVLKPSEVNIDEDLENILFIDRKIIHQSDSITAQNIYRSLKLRRDNLADDIYYGLRDGFNTSVMNPSLRRGYGLTNQYVNDSVIPEPLTAEELQSFNRSGVADYIISLEYCIFRINERAHLLLEDNVFFRLYRIEDGKVLDEITSNDLKIFVNTNHYRSDKDIVEDYFYRNGRRYVERILPVWVSDERTLFTGNKLLETGYKFYMNDDFENARRTWNSALTLKDKFAVQAAVNLAWLYERDGNFESGKKLLESALRQYDYKNDTPIYRFIEGYINILNGRIEDQKKLDEQL